jgi:hypothetical protein
MHAHKALIRPQAASQATVTPEVVPSLPLWFGVGFSRRRPNAFATKRQYHSWLPDLSPVLGIIGSGLGAKWRDASALTRPKDHQGEARNTDRDRQPRRGRA